MITTPMNPAKRSIIAIAIMYNCINAMMWAIVIIDCVRLEIDWEGFWRLSAVPARLILATYFKVSQNRSI